MQRWTGKHSAKYGCGAKLHNLLACILIDIM